jgi:hypothetical protein
MTYRTHSTHGALAARVHERPRPLTIGVAYLALSACALAAGLVASAPLDWTLTGAVSFALAGSLGAGRAARELSRRRRVADAWLLRHPLGDPIQQHAWRADELTSRRERRALARSLWTVIGEVDGRLLPGPVPINRVGLRPYLGDLRLLAGTLDDRETTVRPGGILLVHDLLTSPGSPLYPGQRVSELPVKVSASLDALGVHDV